MGQYDLAQKGFAKAFELMPSYGLWQHNWTNLYILHKDVPTAIEFRNFAMDKSPHWKHVFMLSGLCCMWLSATTMHPYQQFPCLVCNFFPDFWREYEKIIG